MADEKQKKSEKKCLATSLFNLKANLLPVLVLFAVLLSSCFLPITLNPEKLQEPLKLEVKKPKYWNVSLSTWNPNGNLRTMNRVFQRLGYKPVNGSNGEDWDVLWSIEYPYNPQFTVFDSIYKQPLKQHQRINHFPGIGVLADKSFLMARHHDLRYILPAFGQTHRKQFESYALKNPTRKFVQKYVQNRGVKVVEKSEIDFSKDYQIYQPFLDNPMLIDGRGFDMGVYVLISSIEPLRVYRYNTEMLVRFCPEPYHPFNASNTRQYVIDESHTSITDMPSFRIYPQNFGFSSKKLFEEYLKRQKHDVNKYWREIDEIISTIIGRNEEALISEVRQVDELSPTSLNTRNDLRNLNS